MAKTSVKKKRRSDSPIMVGGGGGKRKTLPYISVDFAHHVYIPDEDYRDTYVNPKLSLDYVRVLKNDVEVARYPTDGRVEIKYKKADVFGTDKIRINERKMGVGFAPKHIPYSFDSEQHYGTALEFRSLKIDNDEKPVDTTGTWVIEAHTKLGRRRGKTRRQPTRTAAKSRSKS